MGKKTTLDALCPDLASLGLILGPPGLILRPLGLVFGPPGQYFGFFLASLGAHTTFCCICNYRNPLCKVLAAHVSGYSGRALKICSALWVKQLQRNWFSTSPLLIFSTFGSPGSPFNNEIMLSIRICRFVFIFAITLNLRTPNLCKRRQ